MSYQDLVKPLLNNGAQISNIDLSENAGYPNLDPIWIQPEQIQRAVNSYSNMSFNPSFGLSTVLSHLQPALSPIPTRIIHHQPQNWSLEDSDLNIPLPESIINDINPTQLPTINQEGLDGINPVQNTNYIDPGQHPRQLPLTKIPQKINPRDQFVARNRRAQAFQQKMTDPTSVPNQLRPKILKEVNYTSVSNKVQSQSLLVNPNQVQGKPKKKIDQKRVPKVTPKKAKAPAPEKMPYQKAIKSTQTIFDDEEPVFHRKEFNRIHYYMKRLDTTQPIFATPQFQALKVAQQRQQWLQACNVIFAEVNRKESCEIFALYARHPFPTNSCKCHM